MWPRLSALPIKLPHHLGFRCSFYHLRFPLSLAVQLSQLSSRNRRKIENTNSKHMYICTVFVDIYGWLWHLKGFPQWKIHAPKIPPRLDMLPFFFSPCGRVPYLSSPWWLAIAFRSFWRICLRYIENHWDTVIEILSKWRQVVYFQHPSASTNHPLEIEQAPCPQCVQKEQKVTIANLRMLIQEKQRSSQIFCITRHLQQLPRRDFWWGHRGHRGHRGRLSKNARVLRIGP